MVEEISVKKVVDRKIAIALVIICIILAVGIVGAVAFYSQQINTIQSKASEIASLTSQVSSLTSQVSSLTSQVSSLTSQVSSLTSQIADNSLQIQTLTSQKNELQDIVSLAKSTIWVS